MGMIVHMYTFTTHHLHTYLWVVSLRVDSSLTLTHSHTHTQVHLPIAWTIMGANGRAHEYYCTNTHICAQTHKWELLHKRTHTYTYIFTLVKLPIPWRTTCVSLTWTVVWNPCRPQGSKTTSVWCFSLMYAYVYVCMHACAYTYNACTYSCMDSMCVNMSFLAQIRSIQIWLFVLLCTWHRCIYETKLKASMQPLRWNIVSVCVRVCVCVRVFSRVYVFVYVYARRECVY